MKINNSGTTIIESIIVLMIVLMGTMGAMEIYKNSQDLSISTKNKLIAIDIARQGIEAVTNIRDTNWLLFSANNEECWNSINYKTNCLTSHNQTSNNIRDFTSNGVTWNRGYTLTNNGYRWYLYDYNNTAGYLDSNYMNNFIVKKDNNGFYCQGGSGSGCVDTNNINPKFTREIRFNYGSEADSAVKTKVEVTSLVQWTDGTSSNIRKVEISTILSNWTNPFE